MTLEQYKQLRRQGKSPEQAFAGQPEQLNSSNFSLEETMKNIPSSAGRFLGGLANIVAHPIQTIKTLGGVAAGTVEKLIPGQQAEEKYIDGLVDIYKERYGGVDKALNTLEQDPIGVLADLSTILTGGGAIASKIGTVSKLGKVAKAGEVIAQVGNKINPLSVVSKVTQPLKDWLPDIAKTIEQSNWRLTKTKEGALLTKASDEAIDAASMITKNKLNEVANFMAEQKIIGTPLGRYAKATELYNKTESILDDFFNSISKSAPQIKGSDYIRSLNGLKNVYKGHRDFEAIVKQINSAIKSVENAMDKSGKISYKTFNKFKRTTFENAFNKVGDKVIDDIEFVIGDAARGMLDESMRGLKIAGQSFEEFNHNYGLLIEGRKIIKSAVGKTQMSKLFESLLGGTLGYAFGSAAGGLSFGLGGALAGASFGKSLIEQLPVTAIKSGIGASLETLGKAKIPQVITKIKAPVTAAERITEKR